MYDDHYGLNGRPFQLTPDPRFWFDTATHRKAMAYLGYGLSQGEGFIVITGEVGAGKTTLVGHLVGTIDAARLNVIRLVSTQIAADDLLRTVCAGLSVDAAGLTKAQMLAAIERGLHAVAREGRRTLLIVDEAQALPVDSLEELRMLSNFQSGGYALLQIILLGQPEFRDNLAAASLEQLRQRVIAMHHLGPMEPEELEPYIVHRLQLVGWTGRPRFGTDALAAIYGWSGGIPRRVNQLVSRVLLHGAIEDIDRFVAADVAAVVDDMSADGMIGGAVPAPEPELDFGPADPRPIAVDADPAPVDADGATPMEWPFTRAAEIDAEHDAGRPITLDTPADADDAPIVLEPPVAVEDMPIVLDPPVAVEDVPIVLDPPVTVEDVPIVLDPPVAVEDAPIVLEPPLPVAEVPEPEPEPEPEPAPQERLSVAVQPQLASPAAARQSLFAAFRRLKTATVDADPADAAGEMPAADVVVDAPAAEVASTEDMVADTTDIARRLTAIEARLEDQDAALRRVLTLLVDWVEGGAARPDLAELRDRVA